jgi:hypothetical protein
MMTNKAIVEYEDEEGIDSALMFDDTLFREDDEGLTISVEPFIQDLTIEKERKAPSPI